MRSHEPRVFNSKIAPAEAGGRLGGVPLPDLGERLNRGVTAPRMFIVNQ